MWCSHQRFGAGREAVNDAADRRVVGKKTDNLFIGTAAVNYDGKSEFGCQFDLFSSQCCLFFGRSVALTVEIQSKLADAANFTAMPENRFTKLLESAVDVGLRFGRQCGIKSGGERNTAFAPVFHCQPRFQIVGKRTDINDGDLRSV